MTLRHLIGPLVAASGTALVLSHLSTIACAWILMTTVAAVAGWSANWSP